MSSNTDEARQQLVKDIKYLLAIEDLTTVSPDALYDVLERSLFLLDPSSYLEEREHILKLLRTIVVKNAEA